MARYYYGSSIAQFLNSDSDAILAVLARSNEFSLQREQREAWINQVNILREALNGLAGNIYLEYNIPRMGKRIDVVLLVESVLFVIEFKVGEKVYEASAIDQVWDYGLDLHYFHETSHDLVIAPVLVATRAKSIYVNITSRRPGDTILDPIKTNQRGLRQVIDAVLNRYGDSGKKPLDWESGGYHPTPTIIEAAKHLFRNHNVEDIARTDAGAVNLSLTTNKITDIINRSRQLNQKSICFVTGVPGAGKTLVGLSIATTHMDMTSDSYSVFLSGNGPLVAVLREALARDRYALLKQQGTRTTKGNVLSEVKAFIQNVHNFRDDCLESEQPPFEHVAIFDEAQRAWNSEQTSNFMRRKRNRSNFDVSEPEFLISCMDRHDDWAVIVCLVGGGQEINTGEAGIGEWLDALKRSYSKWHVYISPELTDAEYGASAMIEQFPKDKVHRCKSLHLAVSMRSFRSEKVSKLVKYVLDLEAHGAQEVLKEVKTNYPVFLTRDLALAKTWLRQQARGSERYGIVVSSEAERLRPEAINVKAPMDPVHWFLAPKSDIRSSYYLEDVATEFDVQGLELDWTCVVWDGDFRYAGNRWEHWSFSGERWKQIHKEDRRKYQKNAYRVLLTRARQGMVIVVPQGNMNDPTRDPAIYDPTYSYLKSIGLPEL